MKPIGVVRKVDQLGRIVLPKSLRRRYEMNEGDPVEILVQGDQIILEKHRPRCIFCSSDQQVGQYRNRNVCNQCLEDLQATQ